MIESKKVKGKAKSVVLPNGREVTYCERGENNPEVLITGAFYFHTFMPVLEYLAERYHVYGIVMAVSGESLCKDTEGNTHWGNTWGEDLYGFVKALGIEKFHYLGKCHGVVPGWWMVRHHPEMLIDFCSFYMAPHLKQQTANVWFDTIKTKGPRALLSMPMRKKTGIFKKMKEMASLGSTAKNLEASVGDYAAAPERIWDSLEECEKAMRELSVPVFFLFGSEDVVFHDHYDSNMYIKDMARGSRFKIIPGERHLMELDCPKRVAEEAFSFIDEVKQS